ncbi:glyoxal oxidase [Rhizoctonia solani]|uniref:Glyoxal oxidase n=1 Tax=Rhizoctonia solani TaxID=456999 RepID=A0A8H8P7A2_9AGAM|nr:glyoxal oxidase [Rhizoctonia solani]QRW26896.1 glyoxal oxidase [Rhizoctonia solani]
MNSIRATRRATVALSLSALLASVAADPTVLPAPGQPTKTGTPGTFEIVGDSGVSAQQLFLGTDNRVYIVDKTENNPPKVGSPSHPAWATEYDVDTNKFRAMDIVTNSFCAGGAVLGNGTWLNVGGNQAITWGGLTASSQNGDTAPYYNGDGGKAIRLLDPCEDKKCDWIETSMSTRRWYPTLETLEDGSMIIIGGNQWGGFVNSAGQNNPTYEFFPSKGDPVGLNILTKTLPANLFPLTWLLPSGNLFIQTNWGTEVFDYKSNTEYELDDIPHAVRTYPASGASIMLPLTPANNWTATVLFCGGSDLQPDQWVENWAIAAYPADATCVKMTPDVDAKWTDDDSLPEGRTMGNMIALPNGQIFMVNGANQGVAGYGNVSWSIGQSYADQPVYKPIIYDPSAKAGSRWSRAGLSGSTVARMYHSSATILPDGSVFVTGSNPNADYNVGSNIKYPTESVSRGTLLPSYYSQRRPQPNGLLSELGYGGNYFNVTLSKDDLFGNVSMIATAKVVLIRPGFSTHAMNMGQRYVELETSYTGNEDGSGVLHVSQLPPNPAILVPGPALVFVTVNGVPSVGIHMMVGSGQLGKQTVSAVQPLPSSSIIQPENSSNGGGGSNSSNGKPSNAGAKTSVPSIALASMLLLVSALL